MCPPFCFQNYWNLSFLLQHEAQVNKPTGRIYLLLIGWASSISLIARVWIMVPFQSFQKHVVPYTTCVCCPTFFLCACCCLPSPLLYTYTVYTCRRETLMPSCRTLINPSFLNKVSSVRMICREVPCAGRTVLTNVQVPGPDQGSRCSNEKWELKPVGMCLNYKVAWNTFSFFTSAHLYQPFYCSL